MSTNAIVAIEDGEHWKGRYVHSDGYPTHTGRVVFEEVKAAGVEAFTEFLTTGPAEWGISFIDTGFITDPRPSDWDAPWDAPWDSTKNVRVYKGRRGEEPSGWVTHETFDWVYIVSLSGLAIEKGRKRWSLNWSDSPDWDAIESEGYA